MGIGKVLVLSTEDDLQRLSLSPQRRQEAKLFCNTKYGGALDYLLSRVIILPVHISCTTSSAGHPLPLAGGDAYATLRRRGRLRYPSQAGTPTLPLAGGDAYATPRRRGRLRYPSQAGTPTLPLAGGDAYATPRRQGRLRYPSQAGTPTLPFRLESDHPNGIGTSRSLYTQARFLVG